MHENGANVEESVRLRRGVGAAALLGRPLGDAVRLAAQPGPEEARYWARADESRYRRDSTTLAGSCCTAMGTTEIINAPLTGAGYTRKLVTGNSKS